jgi:hypothetical protein
LPHAVADEVAADVPVAAPAAADEVATAELVELELELPHAAISPAASAGNTIVESLRAQSKAHNLHPHRRGLPGPAPGLSSRPCAGRGVPEIVPSSGPAPGVGSQQEGA